MSDLVERLRKVKAQSGWVPKECTEAADRIELLEGVVALLEPCPAIHPPCQRPLCVALDKLEKDDE